MIRDELLEHLAMLPPDADVVVDIGGAEEDIVSVEGVSYRTDGNSIALRPHPADLRDAFAARGVAASGWVRG